MGDQENEEPVLDLTSSPEHPDLPITLEREAEVTVVRPAGEIDIANAAVLRRSLNEVVAGGSADLIVDLRDVSFLDSTGLSVLVSCLKQVHRIDGDVRLRNLSPEVERVFELTGLLQIFGTA